MKFDVTKDVKSVYLTFQKTDYKPELQLAVNAISSAASIISFSFDNLNLVNGEYSITLTACSSSGKNVKWNLGKVDVWFKEGQNSATNNHISESFLTTKFSSNALKYDFNNCNIIYI